MNAHYAQHNPAGDVLVGEDKAHRLLAYYEGQ